MDCTERVREKCKADTLTIAEYLASIDEDNNEQYD
jgi:hypothetical protein